MKMTFKSFAGASLVLGIVLGMAAHAELRFDSDIEPALKAQMLNDLAFMKSVQSTSATPLHQKIFGKVDGASYMAWFNQRVFEVGKDDCGSPTAVACVISIYANKMWMTPNYTKFDQPQIARLSVVFHEARHTERQNGNWSHATCPTPFRNDQGQDVRSIWTGALLAGRPACDVTPLGSYGSQTILLKNIAMNCTSCNQKVKADADIFATDQLIRIIEPKSKTAMKSDFGMR